MVRKNKEMVNEKCQKESLYFEDIIITIIKTLKSNSKALLKITNGKLCQTI